MLATLPDGSWQRMVVERDDAMFGNGRDLARLVIASADHFGLGVVPPLLAPPEWEGIVWAPLPSNAEAHGVVEGNVIQGMQARWGDSGSPVYKPNGRLMGIVVSAGVGYTTMERLDMSWLEGT